jgi:translation initiation factor 6
MVNIETFSLYGTPNIGVYVFANDNFSLIPVDAPGKLESKIIENLKVEVYRLTIAGTRLLGVLLAGNNNGILLPRIITDSEIEALKKMLPGVNFVILEDIRETGIGNLVLANDYGCIASRIFSRGILKVIEENLNVECHQMSIGDIPFVGSLAVATNRGVTVPPLASDEEISTIERILKVKAGVLTINRGKMFLKTGLIANTKVALVGEETTGHELMQLQRVLFA